MSRNNVLEKYIIDLCSPTLVSLKTASLINCYFINEKQLEKDIYKNSLIFHLRGGIDYSKLNFKHKTMMKMLYHSLKNKPIESLTQEDKALIETYNTKVDFVDYDSLKQIVEVIQ